MSDKSGQENQRLNRRFAEILQEIRVAQTGVQILFAFLLTLAFSNKFHEISGFTRAVYVTTLMTTLGATGLLTAPVVYHRLTSGRKMRQQLLDAANRFALGGLFMLVVALTGSILLVTLVVFSAPVAVVLTSVCGVWLLLWWYAVPLWHRRENGSGKLPAPTP